MGADSNSGQVWNVEIKLNLEFEEAVKGTKKQVQY